MNIGFIGAGSIAQALARHLIQAGHQPLLSNSRDPASLADTVVALGAQARAVRREEAAAAPIVVLSVPWAQVPAALAGLPDWQARILIDTTNPVLMLGFRLAELDGLSASEVVAGLAPGARLVKMANTLMSQVLSAEARTPAGRRVLFQSGDDAAAKAETAALLQARGFAVVDLGGLASGGRLQQFPGGPLPLLNLLKQD